MNKLSNLDVNELVYIMHEYLDFTALLRRENLSEAFIEEFQNEVDWDYISEYQVLSEDFMRKFKDKIDWGIISYSQKLSESFIEEFQNQVDWFEIIEYQDISNAFIEKMKEKIQTHLWIGMDIYTSTPFKDKKVRKGYILRFEQDNDNTKIDDVKIYVGFKRYPAIVIFNVSELNKNFFLKSPNI